MAFQSLLLFYSFTCTEHLGKMNKLEMKMKLTKGETNIFPIFQRHFLLLRVKWSFLLNGSLSAWYYASLANLCTAKKHYLKCEGRKEKWLQSIFSENDQRRASTFISITFDFFLFIVQFFLFTVHSNDCIVKGSGVINKLIAFYLFVDCIHWLPLYYSLGLFQIKREKEKKCRIERPRNPITIRYQYFDVVKWNGYM